jgi:hypothetical protein
LLGEKGLLVSAQAVNPRIYNGDLLAPALPSWVMGFVAERFTMTTAGTGSACVRLPAYVSLTELYGFE